MPKLELGEPLLSDDELTKVGTRLCVEFPKLLEQDVDFVTWIQKPTEYLAENGLVTRLPEVAVLGVMSGEKLTKGAVFLQHFIQENIDGKAALRIYRPVVKEHLRILEALEGVM